MNASDTWRILQNIVAQQGIECDLYAEFAKTQRMINAIDQGKMMPPPLPPEINDTIEPMPEEEEPLTGKYDNL